MRKMKKGALVAALSGATLFGGCLGGLLNPQRLVNDLTSALITEFLTDNDGFFDLFEDGDVAAAQ